MPPSGGRGRAGTAPPGGRRAPFGRPADAEGTVAELRWGRGRRLASPEAGLEVLAWLWVPWCPVPPGGARAVVCCRGPPGVEAAPRAPAAPPHRASTPTPPPPLRGGGGLVSDGHEAGGTGAPRGATGGGGTGREAARCPPGGGAGRGPRADRQPGAAGRGAGAPAGRGPGAADGHRRHPARDQPVAGGPAAGPRRHRGRRARLCDSWAAPCTRDLPARCGRAQVTAGREVQHDSRASRGLSPGPHPARWSPGGPSWTGRWCTSTTSSPCRRPRAHQVARAKHFGHRTTLATRSCATASPSACW